MRAWASLAAVFIVLAGCARSDGDREAPHRTDARTPATPTRETLPALRPATTNPLRIPVGAGTVVVELRLDPPRFMVSEPVLAHLVVRVEGAEVEGALFSGGPDTLGRPPLIDVVFRTADGRVLPVPGDTNPGGTPGFGLSGYRPARLERPVEQRLLLGTYASGLVPGRYTVHAHTTIQVRPRASERPRDVPIAVELPVEVVTDDPAAMGRVIDALGDRALHGDYDAARDPVFQLEHVRDARVIPWWVRIARAPEYERRYRAIGALASWNDPRAVAALIAATRTSTRDVGDADSPESARADSARALRHAAVHALADSPRPEALDALLALRDSADSEVRLTVMGRLSELPPTEALPHLERYSQDPDSLVRSEARRIRAELTGQH